MGECAELGVGVHAVLQRLEGTRHHGLVVAKLGVVPLELGQVLRLEWAHYSGHVDASSVGNCGKAPQAAAGDDGLGQQAGLGPLGNCFRDEAANHIEFESDRLTALLHRDGGHEGNLVLRTPIGLVSGSLSTEVDVVQLHGTAEQPGRLLAGHGVVELVVQQPSRGVAHAQVSLERQGRDACLSLADVVDGQEPDGQRQFGVFHQGASGQRGPKAAVSALVELAGALHHKIVLRTGALRAAKPLRPTQALESLGALRFGTEVAQKLRDRHAMLELDLVARHQGSPSS